ncbi:MAG: HTH and integrase core domain protein [Dasosvirus sp.]|uniref:HTH and integrase core domain protein n=1 Tax=Dasosvirus sp. TaxID=2487764 RepID=A0A3G4ZTP1_9VIRU|nr:MAG: HTH and integrase core domain protein [Dasosvirus sp.]
MKTNCYPLIFKIKVVELYLTKKVPIKELLLMFGISRGSLYNWIKLHKTNELDEKKKYNKESKYTNYVRDYVCKYVINRVNFDYKRIIKLTEKKYGIKCSKSSVYVILKENNISRKRIKVKANYNDKIAMKTKIKKMGKEIKKIGKENVVSIDESSFDTHINSHYGWSKKGKRIVLVKKEKRIQYSIISAVTMEKVINMKIVKGSINSEIFIEFIKDTVAKIEGNKILLMDNARIHHSKKFKEYTETIENKVLYNIPYCSELNPIEMVFSKVKHVVRKRDNTKIL